MPNLVVIGMQWGDEGKGKIVDLLCPAFDAVARFQGGNNAGHTVKFADRRFALHLIPSGILHPGVRCVLGNGMVLSPEAFFSELEELAAAGVEVEDNVFVSDRVQLILPLHIDRDRRREAARGRQKIGTTGRGIGPAYESKVARSGLRAGDLVRGDAEIRRRRVRARLEGLVRSGDSATTIGREVERLLEWGERLEPFVCDTSRCLNDWIDRGLAVLFEGAQGSLLDVDHGTYPYVTSSSSTAGGAATGSGVAPNRLGGVLGVLKAYTTRVGEGPFVGELEDRTGESLRSRGVEVGTTTGRPRRCGWLDAVAARYACRLNGVDAIALTKLDVLDELDEISITTAYQIGGETRQDFPATVEELEAAEPVLEVVPGWRQSTVGVTSWSDLPAAARAYVRRVEMLVGAPVTVVSTGPRREETIVRFDAGLDTLVGERRERIERALAGAA